MLIHVYDYGKSFRMKNIFHKRRINKKVFKSSIACKDIFNQKIN